MEAAGERRWIIFRWPSSHFSSRRRRRLSLVRLARQLHSLQPRLNVLDHRAIVPLPLHLPDGVKLCMQNSSNLSGSASKSNQRSRSIQINKCLLVKSDLSNVDRCQTAMHATLFREEFHSFRALLFASKIGVRIYVAVACHLQTSMQDVSYSTSAGTEYDQ